MPVEGSGGWGPETQSRRKRGRPPRNGQHTPSPRTVPKSTTSASGRPRACQHRPWDAPRRLRGPRWAATRVSPTVTAVGSASAAGRRAPGGVDIGGHRGRALAQGATVSTDGTAPRVVCSSTGRCWQATFHRAAPPTRPQVGRHGARDTRRRQLRGAAVGVKRACTDRRVGHRMSSAKGNSRRQGNSARARTRRRHPTMQLLLAAQPIQLLSGPSAGVARRPLGPGWPGAPPVPSRPLFARACRRAGTPVTSAAGSSRPRPEPSTSRSVVMAAGLPAPREGRPTATVPPGAHDRQLRRAIIAP